MLKAFCIYFIEFLVLLLVTNKNPYQLSFSILFSFYTDYAMEFKEPLK